ncbi:hypothetical protein Pcinc_018746 [Petrolisthes cinctipes]|uniref:Uncharacterized protein n=1 Tax=Petrolisthes cinctipes TaxID=88211 RepID=A0AAE1FMI7_PETCI|nr:hypothetical protein Pcinc_018746 [Petrolisthes cinctipes]
MGDDGEVSIYDLSYCLMGILGAVTTMLINSAVSILTGGKEGRKGKSIEKRGSKHGKIGARIDQGLTSKPEASERAVDGQNPRPRFLVCVCDRRG